ncbi:condensation domain-containing protein, partial [Pyxidicoccus sp. 3LFB2]
MTRGYQGQPELTAERYVPDPYSPVPGARMYRSGDKVRWLRDGSVEFIGRADFQVKVRGFRVEPGEVATALREHPAVREALVVAREDVPGDKRLVAYVVPSEPVPSESLRAFLQERLPAYMVPSAFVALEALPLTGNGKVDRKALPAPEAPSSEASYVAPRTPTEEALASIWAGLLRVEKVGVNEDFFALGGHSLLATQVVSRLRQSFQVELPVRALFEAPTVAALAERVDSARRSASVGQAPAIVPVPRGGPLPVSFAQQRLWFLDQYQPGSAVYNMPAALRLEGALEVDTLKRGFDLLVRRHESLRTTFAVQDGEPVQVIHPAADFSLPVVDLSALAPELREAEAHRLIGMEVLRPFDLAQGPLFRALLFRLSEEQHLLLVSTHHIVSDAWSSGVLVRELAALYEAFLQGRPSPLPELPVQYADYAAWQRAWLQGDVLQRQLDYWRQQLSGAPALLELPTHTPRPAVQSHRGASVPVSFSRAFSDELLAFCQRQGTTPFMTL